MEESPKYPPGMQMRFSPKDERQYLEENSSYPNSSRNPQGHKSSPTNQFLNFVKGKVKIAYDSVKNAFNWHSDSTVKALENLSQKNNLGPIFDSMKGQNLSQGINGIENSSETQIKRNYDIGDAKKSSFLNVLKFHKDILTFDIKTRMDNEKLTIIPRLTHCENYPKLVRPRNKFLSFEKLSQGYRAIRFDEFGNIVSNLKDPDIKDLGDDPLPSLVKSDSKYKLKKQVSFSTQKLALERRTSKLIGYNPNFDVESENAKPQTQKKIKLANGKYVYANQELIMLNLKSKPKPKEVQIYKKPTKSSLSKSSLIKGQESFSKHREYAKLDKGYIHESSFASDFNVNDSKLETDEEDNYYNNQMISSTKKYNKRRSAEFDEDYEQQYDNQDEFNLPQSPIHKREDGDDEENEDDNADLLDNNQEPFDEIHQTTNAEPNQKEELQSKQEPEIKEKKKELFAPNPFSLITKSTPTLEKKESPKDSPKLEEKKEESKTSSFGPSKFSLFSNLSNSLKPFDPEKPKEKETEENPKNDSLSASLSSLSKPATEASDTVKSKTLFSLNFKKPEETKTSTGEKKPENATNDSLPSTQPSEPEKPKILDFINKKAEDSKPEDKEKTTENKPEEKQAKKVDSTSTSAVNIPDEKKAENEKDSTAEKSSEETKTETKDPKKTLFSGINANSLSFLQNKPISDPQNPFATKLNQQSSENSKPNETTNTNPENPFIKAAPITSNSSIDNFPFRTNSTNNLSSSLAQKNMNQLFSSEDKLPENPNPISRLGSQANNLFSGILGNQVNSNNSSTNNGQQNPLSSNLTSGNSPFANLNNNKELSGGIFNATPFSLAISNSMNNNTNSNENKSNSLFGNLGSINTMNFNNNNYSNTGMANQFGNSTSNQPQNSSSVFGSNSANSGSNSNPFFNVGGNTGNSFLGNNTFSNKPNNVQSGVSQSFNLNQPRGAVPNGGPRKPPKEKAFG